jgi:hypothetical protein
LFQLKYSPIKTLFSAIVAGISCPESMHQGYFESTAWLAVTFRNIDSGHITAK